MTSHSYKLCNRYNEPCGSCMYNIEDINLLSSMSISKLAITLTELLQIADDNDEFCNLVDTQMFCDNRIETTICYIDPNMKLSASVSLCKGIFLEWMACNSKCFDKNGKSRKLLRTINESENVTDLIYCLKSFANNIRMFI